MFAELECTPGTWQPPTYPHLLHKSWRTEFLKAEPARKTDIANMWCWRFEVETKDKENHEKLDVISQLTSWLREIKPYVTRKQNEFVSPYFVVPNFIAYCLSGVPQKNVKRFNLLYDTLCFGEPSERVEAIKQMAVVLGIFNKKPPQIKSSVFVLVASATWNAITEHDHNNEHLATAIKFTLKSECVDGSGDPRAVAWARITNRYEKLTEKQTAQYLSIIQDMPVQVVIEGLLFHCRRTRHVELDNNEYFKWSTHLAPQQIEKPNLYDALAYLVPKYKGWWQSAHALGLTVDEAVAKVEHAAEVSEVVELPSDLGVTV